MKIKINTIKNSQTAPVVFFNCLAGKGAGLWIASEPPVLNREYSVEIDIEKTITELDHDLSDLLENKIYLVDDSVRFSGIIEDIENDGMCYFRLASDCLIMIELGQEEFKIGQILKITLNYDDIKISPQ